MDIKKLIETLSKERPVFHSEADFQHALAWLIHQEHSNADVRLEVPFVSHHGNMCVDIVVKIGDKRHLLELKYKTRQIEVEYNDERYNLQSHVALPLGRYDVLKDVQRIERLIEAGKADAGAVVFITNDSAYWSNPKTSEDTSAAFSLRDGRHISGVMDWSLKTSAGTKKKREEPIGLSGAYVAEWREYSKVESSSYRSFRYLLFPIKNALNQMA